MKKPTLVSNRQKFSLRKRRILETSDEISVDNFYYKEISELTEAGGWSVNFLEKKSFFDEQARNILNVPRVFIPTLKSGYRFYAKGHVEKAAMLFSQCAQGESFSTRIKMVTYDGKEFWARAKGKPLRDQAGTIIGVRGVFQNIDDSKNREEHLTQSLQIIEAHNARLYDFAHIISHNLRSQVSNLQMSATLFDKQGLTEEQKELLHNFNEIGQSLDTTLKHLNKMVGVHHTASKTRELVVVEEVYRRVVSTISQTIKESEAIVTTEFVNVPEVLYLEVYIESIIYNLLTNAIKYRHPERLPEISIFTYTKNEKNYLAVKDNGLGIDLHKYGNDIFKLYKTFHKNSDAVGLGLFLLKNEVEAMGGHITIESNVAVGSTFTVEIV